MNKFGYVLCKNGWLDASYQKNGYLLCKNLIPVDCLDQIYNEIKLLFNSSGFFEDDLCKLFKNNFALFRNTANISQYLASITKLSVSKEIIDVLKFKLGINLPIINTKPLISYSYEELASSEMYWKIPAHQDWASTQGSLDGITAWLPLVNLYKDMGYLEVVPGSHLLGSLKQNGVLLEKNQTDNMVFEPIEMDKTDVLFFNNFLIHRSGVNVSENIRLSAHFRYDNANEPEFRSRQYPHYRVETKACDGFLSPNLDTKKEINAIFKERL